MRKAIVFLVAAGLALAACIVNSFDDASATVAAPEGTGIADGLGGEITFPADSDVGTVRFVIPAEGDGSGAARSVSGAGLSDVKSVGRGVRNIYQLIAVDESNPNAVWGFAEVSGLGGTLSVGILKGHTYRFLFLAGHADDAGLTLLASGYRKAKMTTEAGSSRFSLLMTPLVVDVAFVRNGADGGEARQVGRLAKTVGLDANASYTFRVILGSDEAGVLAPDDALRAASGNGIAPLVEAEAGASSWGDLSLVSNAAWFGGTPLTDWNDANKTNDENKPHTTRGTAEYMLTTPVAGGAPTTASFKMEYAPFGLAGDAWTGVNGDVKPVWVIRNGLNDDPQTDATDFANYGKKDDQGVLIKPAANANGGISVAVVDAAARPAGLYEDNNPWPLLSFATPAAGDLEAALNYLDDAGTAAKYGAYTIRLGVDPTLPAYPGEKIMLGDGSGAAWEHPTITNTALIIEGTAPVAIPGRELLWALNNGDSVRYGNGVVPPIIITPSAGILDSAFSVRTTGYAVAVPSNVNEVTFTALVLDASAAVSYDTGTGYSDTPPLATLSGLSGSVTFSVKVKTATTEHVWGPYTFDVSRSFAYTIGGGLVYEFFDGADYEGLKFTSGTNGTFTVIDYAPPDIDLLVVGGGGSGGGYVSPGGGPGANDGGGGGAGGLVYKTGFTVQAGDYTVSIGSGGGGVPYDTNGVSGGLSTFYLSSAGEPGNGISDSGAKAPGGGYGGYASGGSGGAGGSGGGGGRWSSGAAGLANGGATVTGHDGAAGVATSGAGGGGGAGGPGQASTGAGTGSNTRGGLGGPGLTLDITGTPYTYATGGIGGNPNALGGFNYGDGGGGGNYTGGGAAHSGIVVIRWEK